VKYGKNIFIAFSAVLLVAMYLKSLYSLYFILYTDVLYLYLHTNKYFKCKFKMNLSSLDDT
jgi:hypothetical protein